MESCDVRYRALFNLSKSPPSRRLRPDLSNTDNTMLCSKKAQKTFNFILLKVHGLFFYKIDTATYFFSN